jgi:hypothetical protein
VDVGDTGSAGALAFLSPVLEQPVATAATARVAQTNHLLFNIFENSLTTIVLAMLRVCGAGK